ncbi:substrate-binding periplasmic protein [Pseudoalteromonas peptidolytica]|uniref:substrate-binding periplasmic protein n=1 Tax=Pseudoalteromonas peptidolytica TaxID=61150 RepID=UPI00298E4CB2|nr:transporter substrate-binding domain-containing protein [Pseudoalteromonas peptidolytica]MDW7549623.1 transporter substrate-binding domain-containing protein [Pseudoalteromonas peptidolytica]
MKAVWLIVILVCISCNTRALEAHVNITTGQWPPYLDQAQQDQGCVAKVIRDAFALSNIKVRFLFMPWERAYQEGMKASYIGSAYWYYSEQRSRDYHYTEYPLTEEIARFYHHKTLDFQFTSYADLKPHKLLLNRGLTYPKALLDAIDTYAIKTSYATYTSKNIALILRARADIMIMDEKSAKAYLKELPVDDAKLLVAQPEPAFVQHGYLLINKHHSEYLAPYNRGLKTLLSDMDYVARFKAHCERALES